MKATLINWMLGAWCLNWLVVIGAVWIWSATHQIVWVIIIWMFGDFMHYMDFRNFVNQHEGKTI